jgi:formate-dependent nitrite reductase membrane component NrfD
MIGAPSSTWFTAPPHWEWLIVLYFFIGGLAGGSYFLAALIDLLGRDEDAPLARLGYYIAFPCVVLSGLLLIADLGRPLRFWHMLIESNTFRPMFKSWSPMSVGSWALLIFGLFSFVSFLAALAEEDRVTSPGLRRFQWPAFRRFRASSSLKHVINLLGGIAGFYLAGYTGVLLAVTNRPIWSDTSLIGMLFVISAASTSAALMMLLAHRNRWTMPGIAALQRMDGWVLVLELLALIAAIVSLGPVIRAWLNAWGLLLLFGVILPGLLVPLAHFHGYGRFRQLSITTTAVLVLVGGLLLRVVIIFSAQSV